jgi:hypothetical protein
MLLPQKKAPQEFPRQEDQGRLPKCSLTEDSEFFGSEECNEHNSSLNNLTMKQLKLMFFLTQIKEMDLLNQLKT